jgi:endonuclease/exonuclease/phosphatase family metal-dependent hydrolase
MKNIFLFPFILTTALYFASCSSSEKSTSLADSLKTTPNVIKTQFKILSVNAHHELKDKSDVKQFADWIKSTGAEVIAVQQIERATDSKPGFDAYSELLKSLDMRGTFAKARYFQGWDSGNALFCLYPLLQSTVHTLPTGKGKVRRSMSFAVFEMGLGSMAFGSADLDDEDLAERVKQVYEILSIQKSNQESPMIIGCNFGESSKGKAATKMAESYFCANNASEQTAGLDQQIYFPLNGKMKVLLSEKKPNNEFKTTGILVTAEVTR